MHWLVEQPIFIHPAAGTIPYQTLVGLFLVGLDKVILNCFIKYSFRWSANETIENNFQIWKCHTLQQKNYLENDKILFCRFNILCDSRSLKR